MEIAAPACENLIQDEIIHFEKSHNAENCKKRTFETFYHSFCCKIF